MGITQIRKLLYIMFNGIVSDSQQEKIKAKMQNHIALLNPVLKPLTLGSISPAGWLKKQLQIQAKGLTGHLDEFWPDIKDSGWIGGEADGWERGPYWLDGLVPLAFLLEDPVLIGKVQYWIDYILSHQQPDGWLGPVKACRSGNWFGLSYDPWPVFILLKALTQYADATNDPRIVPAISSFLRGLNSHLDETPLFEWGQYRWQDLVLSIFWVYEHVPQPWLLDLAEKVKGQGFDWRMYFHNFNHFDKMKIEDCNMYTHGPNNAMAVKAPGVWFRKSGDPADREAVFQIIKTLDQFHGQATGMFSGDEHYAGKNPSQGIELCAVVEYLFSLETLVSIFGSVELADRLERIAFNALPATFSPDMWAHQYDQQPNQVICRVSEDRIYTDNGPEANIFGLAPHFGCCTANMHQGWPKFVSHLWMQLSGWNTHKVGLAAIAYAPCHVSTEVNGTPVEVDVQTSYPFSEVVQITIRTPIAERFTLLLRIPEWAKGAILSLDNGECRICPAGHFYCLDREWREKTTITLKFPMSPRFERRYNNALSIYRGPLLYALKIEEEWRQIAGELPHADWEVYPVSHWNYALEIDPTNPDNSITFQEHELGECPFSPAGAPVSARVMGRLLPEWMIEHNAAAPPPESPVSSGQPLEELTLIPYGCTNLRITEFPTTA